MSPQGDLTRAVVPSQSARLHAQGMVSIWLVADTIDLRAGVVLSRARLPGHSLPRWCTGGLWKRTRQQGRTRGLGVGPLRVRRRRKRHGEFGNGWGRTNQAAFDFHPQAAGVIVLA